MALEKLFAENEVAFRVKLMELCNAIPMQVKGDHRYNEEVEVAADLKLAMLGKIIKGWTPRYLHGGPWGMQEDAAICFQFLCDSYEKAPPYQRWGNYPNFYAKKEPGSIRKGILDLIREHLETHRLGSAELDLLVAKVAQPVPDPIRRALCHARVKQTSMFSLQKEAAERLTKA